MTLFSCGDYNESCNQKSGLVQPLATDAKLMKCSAIESTKRNFRFSREKVNCITWSKRNALLPPQTAHPSLPWCIPCNPLTPPPPWSRNSGHSPDSITPTDLPSCRLPSLGSRFSPSNFIPLCLFLSCFPPSLAKYYCCHIPHLNPCKIITPYLKIYSSPPLQTNKTLPI